MDETEESGAIVRRLFLLAAERIGSVAALAEYLGLDAAELRPYLRGQLLPPEEVLLRTVDLLIDDLKTIRSGFSEAAWRAVCLPRSGPLA